MSVITEMWELIGELGENDEEDDKGEKIRMRVRVHCFVEPNQLPSVRIKRDYYEVRAMS